jgi:16S rRNA (adenine1518-N6/adenine1519-N6)-dimethyltransferase
MELCDMRQIKRLLGRHGFRFSKSMGQNFLIDPTVPQEIAAVSGAGVGVGVLEIGPGIGALTEQLAQRAERVTAIELDGRLLPILEETLKEYDNVSVVNGDVLKLDLPSLAAERFAGLTPVVCANLPYNITTPVLSALLEAKCFRSITVMIQREVARRICAAPRTSDYGAFSLFCQYHASCELLFEVPPESFLPAPKVTSAVVQLRPTEVPPVPVENEALFFRTVRASFAMRRKTLLNGLANGFSGQLTKGELSALIQSCGFPLNVRGEQLGLAEFARLAEAIEDAISC